jgi:hypothetical protein
MASNSQPPQPFPGQGPYQDVMSSEFPCLSPPDLIFRDLEPYLINTVKTVRKVRDYKQYQVQFMEATGLQTIGPFENGLELVSVYVSGPTQMKCITDTMLMVGGLTKGQATVNGKLTIDTSKVNDYTDGDIEPGTAKMFSINYITEDITYNETKKHIFNSLSESTMQVEGRDINIPGTNKGFNRVLDGLNGSEQYSSVYAVNRMTVDDFTAGTYGNYSPTFTIKPIDTSNCNSLASTKSCS